MDLLEGWKQIADFLGYTERHVMRIFRDVMHLLPDWGGSKSRVKLTKDQLRDLIKEVRNRRVELYKRSRIYFIGDDHIVKIGISTNVERRLQQLQKIKSTQFKIYHTFEGSFSHEKVLHERFKKYALGGEWFLLNPEILEFINRKPEKTQLDVA